jgi:hypothetical protein
MMSLVVTVTERYYVEAYSPEDARLAVEDGHARLMDVEVDVEGALGGRP